MNLVSDDTSQMASLQWLNMIRPPILPPLSFVFSCFLRLVLCFACVCLCECTVGRESEEHLSIQGSSPLGSYSRQSSNAHFKVWVERWPLIERLFPSICPHSSVSDVTGHFHTPTLLCTLLFILLWTWVGHNHTVVLLAVVELLI